MLALETIDHIGLRVSDRVASVEFYETLGFKFIVDGGFEGGHPIIMRHESGITLNLLGPAEAKQGENILMDEPVKYPGITHFALSVSSMSQAEEFLTDSSIEITGRFEFGGYRHLFIRDPDKSVIELIGRKTESGSAKSD